jgi:hypothetical protein
VRRLGSRRASQERTDVFAVDDPVGR